jgi:hypothetical protein
MALEGLTRVNSEGAKKKEEKNRILSDVNLYTLEKKKWSVIVCRFSISHVIYNHKQAGFCLLTNGSVFHLELKYG